MDSDQLFEDYDPDMEDVFGRKDQLKPKCIAVTEQQKADPLRKPKIVLQAILTAEKLPMTIRQIEARMLEEDGKIMDSTQYGFSSLDELLRAIPDYVVHRRQNDGTHVYMAKVNEANRDIVELVQLQSNRGEAKRAPRSFLSNGSAMRVLGSHGASFRSYAGQKFKAEDIVKGTAENFQARSELGPSKTAARVRNLADVLRKSRDTIGQPHPENRGRMIVTLADLQKKFFEIYALPPWGKKMCEEDLYKELNKPEFASILTFWRLREDGDIYVEEVNEDKGNTADDAPEPVRDVAPSVVSMPATEQDFETANESNLSLQTIVEAAAISDRIENSEDEYSGVGDDSGKLLEADISNESFFPVGAGFGGKSNSRNQKLQQKCTDEFSDIARRFGVSSVEPASSVKSSLSSNGLDISLQSFESHNDSRSNIDNKSNQSKPIRQPPAMRPVDVNFSSRSIVPKNPLKTLADHVKSRGTARYDSLPEEDKQLVNFSSKVFKVFATQPGEMQVRLVDPNIDTSNLKFTGRDLRDPVEADLRWMAEAAGTIRRGRQFLKPIMFVAPRGFLLMTPQQEVDPDEDTKLDKMETILIHYMKSKCTELDHSKVRPGMQAVYIYRQDQSVRYYRVLIIGHAHNDGDVMAILADHDIQYFVDVKLDDLFEMPQRAGFKEYPPNVFFATLFGMQGLAEEEQYVMWKNIDDDSRKKNVCAILSGEDGRVPFVDMIWHDESGNLEWLSQIAKRRGAIMQSDQNSAHLEKTAAETFPNNASRTENVMDFVDYSSQVVKTETPILSSELEDTPIASRTTSVSPDTFDAAANPLSMHTLDMYTLFNRAVEEKNFATIFGISQFARNVLPVFCDSEDALTLLDYMAQTANEKLGMAI